MAFHNSGLLGLLLPPLWELPCVSATACGHLGPCVIVFTTVITGIIIIVSGITIIIIIGTSSSSSVPSYISTHTHTHNAQDTTHNTVNANNTARSQRTNAHMKKYTTKTIHRSH